MTTSAACACVRPFVHRPIEVVGNLRNLAGSNQGADRDQTVIARREVQTQPRSRNKTSVVYWTIPEPPSRTVVQRAPRVALRLPRRAGEEEVKPLPRRTWMTEATSGAFRSSRFRWLVEMPCRRLRSQKMSLPSGK